MDTHERATRQRLKGDRQPAAQLSASYGTSLSARSKNVFQTGRNASTLSYAHNLASVIIASCSIGPYG